jgi:SAM-dependent methyltransferase
MREFDYQWKNLDSKNIQYNKERIKEFLKFTNFKKSVIKREVPQIKNKMCLDAGCGNGRYSYAMLQLGAKHVDSIDLSEEAINKCKIINPNSRVLSIFDLSNESKYDFVLCWGVLNHIENSREGFRKIVSQVKKNGILHIMVYHKDTQGIYEQGRKLWNNLTVEQKIDYCNDAVKKFGGDVHGWFDAFNPKYNWSWTEDEIMKWFQEEGFGNIKLLSKYNINMQGVKTGVDF